MHWKKNSKAMVAAALLVILFVVFLLIPPKKKTLTGPDFYTPSPSEVVSPAEIQYDGETDLMKELESVDPKVLDADFENL